MNIPNSNAISGNEIMGIETSHNCEKEFCSICQEEINLQNQIYEPTLHKLEECGHCFHRQCIECCDKCQICREETEFIKLFL